MRYNVSKTRDDNIQKKGDPKKGTRGSYPSMDHVDCYMIIEYDLLYLWEHVSLGTHLMPITNPVL